MGLTTCLLGQSLRMEALLNGASSYELNNESIYFLRWSVVDFCRLQALRGQKLDVDGDRGVV